MKMAINHMNKPFFEPSSEIEYGKTYINIPYDFDNDLCYCVIFRVSKYNFLGVSKGFWRHSEGLIIDNNKFYILSKWRCQEVEQKFIR